jgi:triosephosphate isomerase
MIDIKEYLQNLKTTKKVEKKDTIQNETENKKEQKEEKKDFIIDPKQHELDELNDRYKQVVEDEIML